MEKITIKVIKPTSKKLHFVKGIKFVSNLGLKDSKDIADTLFNNVDISGIGIVNIDVWSDQEAKDRLGQGASYLYNSVSTVENDLRRYLSEFCDDGKFEVLGRASIRKQKLLELGLGEKSDYIEYIDDFIHLNRKSMVDILSKIDQDSLENIFKIIRDYEVQS
jgi:hypothetical protein